MDGYRFTERSGLPVLTFPVLEGLGVDAVVTTTAGGVSGGPYASLNLGLHVGDDDKAVIENRRRAAQALGASLEDLVFCEQTHGGRAVAVGAGDRGRGCRAHDDAVGDTDALVTTEPDVPLVVMVADCVPLVLVDPAGILACVHAGWRGALGGVSEAALAVMETLGASVGRVRAVLGPAIPATRYQVGPEVAGAASDRFGGQTAGVLVPDGPGRWRFDLWAAVCRLLAEAGVAPANATVARVPTGDGRFFSDRATRPCGRFAVLARLVA